MCYETITCVRRCVPRGPTKRDGMPRKMNGQGAGIFQKLRGIEWEFNWSNEMVNKSDFSSTFFSIESGLDALL